MRRGEFVVVERCGGGQIVSWSEVFADGGMIPAQGGGAIVEFLGPYYLLGNFRRDQM